MSGIRARAAAHGSEVRPNAWATRLRRHLAWVIAIKIVLIALLFAFFFSSGHRPAIDAGGVSDHLRMTR